MPILTFETSLGFFLFSLSPSKFFERYLQKFSKLVEFEEEFFQKHEVNFYWNSFLFQQNIFSLILTVNI